MKIVKYEASTRQSQAPTIFFTSGKRWESVSGASPLTYRAYAALSNSPDRIAFQEAMGQALKDA